jgi:hypothetical protein
LLDSIDEHWILQDHYWFSFLVIGSRWLWASACFVQEYNHGNLVFPMKICNDLLTSTRPTKMEKTNMYRWPAHAQKSIPAPRLALQTRKFAPRSLTLVAVQIRNVRSEGAFLHISDRQIGP